MTSRIAGVCAGHHAQKKRDIGHRSRQRTLDVETEKRQFTGRRRHEPDRRPKPHDVVEAGGISQRAAEVAAVGNRQHPGRERRSGAAARPAGGFRDVVGVDGGSVDLVVGVRPHAELRHVGLADRNGARQSQASDEDRVLDGHRVPVDRGTARERKPDRRFEILEGDREAVQRSHGLARRSRIGVVSEGETSFIREFRDNRVDGRIERVDAVQMRLHHVARGHLSRADQAGDLARAQEAELVRVGGHHRRCAATGHRPSARGEAAPHLTNFCVSALQQFSVARSSGHEHNGHNGHNGKANLFYRSVLVVLCVD